MADRCCGLQCLLLSRWAQLLEVERPSDHILNQLEEASIHFFFVSIRRHTSDYEGAFELQKASVGLLPQMCRQRSHGDAQQHTSLLEMLVQEIASHLGECPPNMRPWRLPGCDISVAPLSLTLVHLLQSACALPPSSSHSLSRGNSLLDPEELPEVSELREGLWANPSRVVSEMLDSSQSLSTAVEFMTQRLLHRFLTPEPFCKATRDVLETIIHDLIKMLFVPELPAADLLLMSLSRGLCSVCQDLLAQAAWEL